MGLLYKRIFAYLQRNVATETTQEQIPRGDCTTTGNAFGFRHKNQLTTWIYYIKINFPTNVELPPWYGQCIYQFPVQRSH